ncbi:MAG TPA: hypothetical protein VIL71_21140 [Spirillospora sp.]
MLFNVYMVTWLVVPLGLRAYCPYQIIKTGTARIKGIGTLARRIAYGSPVVGEGVSGRRGGGTGR